MVVFFILCLLIGVIQSQSKYETLSTGDRCPVNGAECKNTDCCGVAWYRPPEKVTTDAISANPNAKNFTVCNIWW